MGIIELQVDEHIKDKYKEENFDFYTKLNTNEFPNLKKNIRVSLFGTKYLKSKYRSSLSDAPFKSLLLISASKMQLDSLNISQNQKQFHHSHYLVVNLPLTVKIFIEFSYMNGI